MSYFQILETTCSTDVSSCCSDYGIAMFLYVMKNALTVIQVGIPILLLIMAVVQLTKMMMSPDDKKSPKTLFNKFIAAFLVFFTPFIINLVLNMPGLDGFELVACWESADGIAQTLKSSTKYEVEKTDKRKKVVNVEKYKLITDADVKAGKATKADDSSTGGQKIVNYASNFVGNPYVIGGKSLTNGCDCSGFVYSVLKNLKIYKGGYVTSLRWANLGKKVQGGISNAQAGDIVVYAKRGPYGHVAIYDGNGKIVEAQSSKAGITNNRKAENGRTIIAVRRFV